MTEPRKPNVTRDPKVVRDRDLVREGDIVREGEVIREGDVIRERETVYNPNIVRDRDIAGVPSADDRAQPGDVLGIERDGERTHLGETREDEDKRREDAEEAFVDERNDRRER